MNQRMTRPIKLAASFRDPSGFMFRRDGILYRQVNRQYQAQYDQLMSSGLLDSLWKKGWLVHSEEVQIEPSDPELAYKILQPQELPFISYPYEWSFGQYKDAALTTLEILKLSMEKGFVLKDASAYNIQFYHGKAVLIDTLSFEAYKVGEPWVAYRQFCQHFLGPLALMAKTDIRLSQLLRVYIDGIPLDLTSKLLPGTTKLNFGLNLHIHAHAAAQTRYANNTTARSQNKGQMTRAAFLGLIDSLESTVNSLSLKGVKTEWGDYYDDTNYTDGSLNEKRNLVEQFIQKAQPKTIWDLGANTGFFSRVAADAGIFTVAYDIDPLAVDQGWAEVKARKEKNLLPLVLDLTNPSPAIGWANQERMGFLERGPADCVMALALIHHLAISNNVPLTTLAEFFASIGQWLIIEFVPKDDSQVQRLLATREDIFPEYSPEGFETAFNQIYHIHSKESIPGSKRFLYLLERK